MDGLGNLTDLNGVTMKGAFSVVSAPAPRVHAWLPGFGPISAAQTLAYIADMQEVGVPIDIGYISDAHEKKNAAGVSQTGCSNSGTAQAPGDTCYEANLKAYNDAFALFFKRLADDGITKNNTLFVIKSEEGDHFAGANANRTVEPTCTGTPVSWQSGNTCSYPSGKLAERCRSASTGCSRTSCPTRLRSTTSLGELHLHHREPGAKRSVDTAARAGLRQRDRQRRL